jgi:hypothetical protein
MKKTLSILVLAMMLVLPMMAFAGDTEITGIIKSEVGAIAAIQSAPNYLQPPPLYPYLLQIIPGVIGRMPEDSMPEFADIQRLKMKKFDLTTGKVIQEADKVLKVIYFTRGGRIAGFSRVEDYDSDVIKLIPVAMKEFKQTDTSKMRVDCLFKMSSKTIGSSFGGNGATGGFGGGANPISWVTTGGGAFAFAVNTADPKIPIKFYLIQ